MSKNCELVMYAIKEQPVAYDVDKVRRRLNEAKDMDNQIDADHAIKIVREGGLNEPSITDII